MSSSPGSSPPTVFKVDAWHLSIPLVNRFGVASGGADAAESVVFRVTLVDGTVGFGEASPFAAVTTSQERIDQVIALAPDVGRALIGIDVSASSAVQNALRHAAGGSCLRVGAEMACIDAECRQRRIPLWKSLGNHERRTLSTDVTLPLAGFDKEGALEDELSRARAWRRTGFKRLKVKLGEDLDIDIRRIVGLAGALPDVELLLDSNSAESYDPLVLWKELGSASASVIAWEQPARNLDGLARVQRFVGIPVIADESVQSIDDVISIVKHGGIAAVNVKLMKFGVFDSIGAIRIAMNSGLAVMLGGMVESRLAMGCAAAVAFGVGGITYLDLDIPLLLASDPWEGGYRYDGSVLTKWPEAGIGVMPRDNWTQFARPLFQLVG